MTCISLKKKAFGNGKASSIEEPRSMRDTAERQNLRGNALAISVQSRQNERYSDMLICDFEENNYSDNQTADRLYDSMGFKSLYLEREKELI